MNKNGFTTVELVLTMAVVMVIMATITSVTYVYRDRSMKEQIVTDVTNYKNTVTKIIYDDILENENKVIKLEQIDDASFNLKKKNGSTISLEIIDRNVVKDEKKIHEVGILYDGIEYLVPGSESSLITFDGLNFNPNDVSEETNYYSMDIIFSHRNLEDPIKIHFIISTT